MGSKMTTEQSSKVDGAITRERSPGAWYLVAGLIAIFLMLLGTGVFPILSTQLPEIYNTALTMCLSCIGLGEVNFVILGTMAFAFVLFMLMYGMAKRDKSGENK